MTCKDCIHHVVCNRPDPLDIGCEDFSDRSAWVKLPCKVGNTLYEPTDRGTISEYRVTAIRVELFSTFVEWKIKEGIVWRYVHEINSNEIGKTVFLSREEAKQALEERESNEK